ncbi:MAG: MgtC/SapB family protein, partial [Actinomycetota bacterium]|nr:MgtC/SapB family protein [Actinomycetota bacterium]
TTAAAVWLTAAVGACAGAGLPLLAVTAAGMYFLVTLGFSRLSRRLPTSRWAPSELAVRYQDGRGLLREIMKEVTASGFAVADLSTESSGATSAPVVELSLHVYGRGSMSELATKLNEIDGVEAVRTSDANSPGE